MSEFEDKILQKKRDERKRRQQFLFEQIQQYRAGPFPFGDLFWLFDFFRKEDPSDQELVRATEVIQREIADIADLLDLLKQDPNPSE